MSDSLNIMNDLENKVVTPDPEIPDPEILFEHQDFIIINKPAGLVVHPDGRSEKKTLCDFLIQKYPELENVGEDLNVNIGKEVILIKKPGIVHRLDTDTSGIMIVPRTRESFGYFKDMFKTRKVEKIYHAFVYGNIKEDSGKIDDPIGRSKKDFRQWFVGRMIRGKSREALTYFTVLKRSEDKKTTFVEVRPRTGRTHQIRVHLKSIYHPVVSDDLYAKDRQKALGFERVALHASELSFRGLDGKKYNFTADYPSDFKKAIISIDNH